MLETNTLSNWMMRTKEIPLNILYEELHKVLTSADLVHVDESPFEVIRDRRSSGNKSYMWVSYRGKRKIPSHPLRLPAHNMDRSSERISLELFWNLMGLLRHRKSNRSPHFSISMDKYDESKDKDRKSYRQREVAPKVDDYFAIHSKGFCRK